MLEGDGEADIFVHLLEIFGIEAEDFFGFGRDGSVLTRRHVERYTDEVVQVVDYTEGQGDTVSAIIYLRIFGSFVLRTGAAISKELKHRIAQASTPETNEYHFDDEEMNVERRLMLKDLHDKILKHQPGQITLLYEEGGGLLKD